MDEWVKVERIVELPSVAAKLGKNGNLRFHVSARSRLLTLAYALTCPAKEHASAKPHHEKTHGDDSPVALADDEDDDGVRKSRRKRKNEEEDDADGDDPTVVADMEHDEHEGMDEASLKEHEEVTKVKVRTLFAELLDPPLLFDHSSSLHACSTHQNPPTTLPPRQNVRTIELGRHVMETWYFSPFPKEYYPLGFIDRVRNASFGCVFFFFFFFFFFTRRPFIIPDGCAFPSFVMLCSYTFASILCVSSATRVNWLGTRRAASTR
jgi:hypothetical protein